MERDIDADLALLEPVRHLALMLGLSTSEWRTTAQACQEAPDVRRWTKGLGNAREFQPYGYYGSSAAHRFVALERKGMVDQSKPGDGGPTTWRLTPYGLNVLQLALRTGALPDLRKHWTPSGIPFAELAIAP